MAAGAAQRSSGTRIYVMILLGIGDLGGIIWEVLAAIIWEAWITLTNLFRLFVAAYPLMGLLFLITRGFDLTTLVGVGCGAYLYTSFLYFFGLRDRLPWALLVATLLTFEGPNPRLLRRAAVTVFMLARDDSLRGLYMKRIRNAEVPWEDGSGFEFLFNFEGRELLREVCLYLVNTLCSSFDRPRVHDDFKLRTSVRTVDVLVLPLIGLVDWAWRYRRARRRARRTQVTGRKGKQLAGEQ
ncbi:hypothetical protein CkaCkLH20_00162 [Colletotrichum karsti]|uniref:Uncharacterized protein n=1 Tax=Colletotrichum karsti TaxID=1095194 RepID=A0A9P6IIQ7_9PEZI|nr:uncharacterized protein CkaCkLH20_00162 [Colletotrichum karsti]KAF9882126.1 hypothetical protein CkaCkLH20_00162 [Colletotrichum karsti]